MAAQPIFTNVDTRTWIQAGGVGSVFNLYSCHALTNWARDFEETTFIKCKSPDVYGKKDIVESVPGTKLQPTFTVMAYTRQDADFLLGLQCPVDFQEFYGKCSSPSDKSAYRKIRHFYQASKNSEGEDNVDFLGDETPAGIEITAEFTAEDVIEILQVALASSAVGMTEAQALNDIDMLSAGRCEGDCGVGIDPCDWGVAVADADYLSATANIWYTKDGGLTWTVGATDPFSENSANCSAVIILPGETAPRIIVFRGNVSGSYGARCSISDDWGASWSEVDMGGSALADYINNAWAYSAGLIYAVGNGGDIYYSTDRGASWTVWDETVTGVVGELYDIHTPDGDTLYAVGEDNVVIKSTDGGESWADTTTSPANGTEDLRTVQAPTRYRVFVGGEIDANEECMWLSEDGGETWDVVAFTGSTTAGGAVEEIRITDEAPLAHMVMIHGTNTNDRVYRSLDGEASWERMAAVTNAGYNGLAVCDINTALICGEPSGGVAVIHKMSA